jgi:hypothetical protein
VAVKLLKRNRKSTKNLALKAKRQFFVKVLSKMRAAQQSGDLGDILEYTTYWTELVDRGGLYNISND